MILVVSGEEMRGMGLWTEYELKTLPVMFSLKN